MSSSSITVQIYRVGHTIAKLKKEKNKVSVNLQLLELRLQRQIRECFNDMIYICIRLPQTKILNFNSIKQNVLRTISNLLFRKRKKRDNTCSWVKLHIIAKQGRRRSCVFHITRTTMNPSFHPSV